MHIWRGAGDFAKRWSFERASVLRVAGDHETAFICEAAVTTCDTGIMKPLVGEARANVAGAASPFSREQFQPFSLNLV